MNKISKFFQRAVKAQMQTAGEMLTITRPKTKETWQIQGVLTSRDGSLQAESGGIIHSITAHALIPPSELYTPKSGDRITANGFCFMILSVIKSPDDGAYSCDLISVQC